ncbi:MAG: endonuclease/exonuclease/phosphatase family protein [Myxococcota bacterium]
MTKSIRVFSGNLWWGRAESRALVDLIRRHEIDVFCAQELGWENAEAIADELPHGRLEPTDHFAGMGIALRHPADYAQIPLYFRPARHVVLEPGAWSGLDRPISLINVHFQAPHAMRPFPSSRVRAKQAAGIEAFVEANPSDARLVVGDYNATPLWPLYRRLARRFSDAAIQSAQREGRPIARTWGPSDRAPRLLRIDHALVRGLRVDDFRVVEIPGSDHSGLLFDITPEPLG